MLKNGGLRISRFSNIRELFDKYTIDKVQGITIHGFLDAVFPDRNILVLSVVLSHRQKALLGCSRHVDTSSLRPSSRTERPMLRGKLNFYYTTIPQLL